MQRQRGTSGLGTSVCGHMLGGSPPARPSPRSVHTQESGGQRAGAAGDAWQARVRKARRETKTCCKTPNGPWFSPTTVDAGDQAIHTQTVVRSRRDIHMSDMRSTVHWCTEEATDPPLPWHDQGREGRRWCAPDVLPRSQPAGATLRCGLPRSTGCSAPSRRLRRTSPQCTVTAVHTGTGWK